MLPPSSIASVSPLVERFSTGRRSCSSAETLLWTSLRSLSFSCRISVGEGVLVAVCGLRRAFRSVNRFGKQQRRGAFRSDLGHAESHGGRDERD